MSSKLLDVLFSNPCTHQFSWPRRSPKGNYYQVCLICGDEYQYDWNTMSRKARIKRVSNPEGSHATPRAAGSLPKTKWVRRARRFRTDLPMQFREKHTELWQEGTIGNISQSGVFIRAAAWPREGSQIEMVFEMPAEISGLARNMVLCEGLVSRRVFRRSLKDMHVFAAAICDSKAQAESSKFNAASVNLQRRGRQHV